MRSPLLKYFGSLFFAAANVAPNPTKAEIPATDARNAPAAIMKYISNIFRHSNSNVHENIPIYLLFSASVLLDLVSPLFSPVLKSSHVVSHQIFLLIILSILLFLTSRPSKQADYFKNRPTEDYGGWTIMTFMTSKWGQI